MFIRHEVILDARGLDRHSKRIQQSSKALDGYVVKTVLPASQRRTDQTINAEPGPHRRPTEWESEKQRRWWFAVGVHQWHGRTGKVRQWKVRTQTGEGSGQIVAANPAAHAKYVYGPYQQRMHKPTWMNVETYRSVESNHLIRDVIRGWVQVNGA